MLLETMPWTVETHLPATPFSYTCFICLYSLIQYQHTLQSQEHMTIYHNHYLRCKHAEIRCLNRCKRNGVAKHLECMAAERTFTGSTVNLNVPRESAGCKRVFSLAFCKYRCPSILSYAHTQRWCTSSQLTLRIGVVPENRHLTMRVPSSLRMNMIWWSKAATCCSTFKFKVQRCSIFVLVSFEIRFFVDI